MRKPNHLTRTSYRALALIEMVAHARPSRTSRSRVRSRGFVLVVALLLIVAATLLTLSVLSSAGFQERMGAVDRDRRLALEAADAALTDGERDLMWYRGNSTSPTNNCATPGPACRVPRLGGSKSATDAGVGLNAVHYNGGTLCGNGICDVDDYSTVAANAAKPWANAAVWTTAGLAVPFGTYTNADPIPHVAKKPLYIIETIKSAQDSILQDLAYRITARGYGANPRTTVLVQSTFVMPPPGANAGAAGPAVPPAIARCSAAREGRCIFQGRRARTSP